METYDLIQLLKAGNEHASHYINEFIDDEFMIDDLDEYELEKNLEIIGVQNPSPEEYPNYWLALIVGRSLKLEVKGQSAEVLKEFIENDAFRKSLGPEYAEKDAELKEFLSVEFENIGYLDFLNNRRERTGSDVTWKSGDLFAFPREDGKFILGRVLLKVSNCLKGKDKNARKNPLIAKKLCYLVETYHGLFEEPTMPENPKVVLPGVFLYPDEMKSGFWKKIGNKKVHLEEIDFPEYIDPNGSDDDMNNQILFCKGEIQIALDKYDDCKDSKTDVHQTILQSYFLDDYTLFQMGQKDQVKYQKKSRDLSRTDLRFNPNAIREKVFVASGLDFNKNYKELAEELNIDLTNYLN